MGSFSDLDNAVEKGKEKVNEGVKEGKDRFQEWREQNS
jgi:hypothetical protein